MQRLGGLPQVTRRLRGSRPGQLALEQMQIQRTGRDGQQVTAAPAERIPRWLELLKATREGRRERGGVASEPTYSASRADEDASDGSGATLPGGQQARPTPTPWGSRNNLAFGYPGRRATG